MEIPNTADNRALASAINSRLRSDARIVGAKAALWRLVGGGVLCALAGVGLGCAFYGYSYIADSGAPNERVAQAFATALDRVKLKLDPGTALPGTALPDTAPAVPKPSAAQLGTDAAPASQAPVATNFTVFKNVPYAGGQVVTGWNFGSSADSQPTHQYCYYSEQLDGGSKVTVDLGENSIPSPAALGAKARVSVDTIKAFQSCVWFRPAGPRPG